MPTLSQADLVDSRPTSANQIRPMPLTGIESAKGRGSFFSMASEAPVAKFANIGSLPPMAPRMGKANVGPKAMIAAPTCRNINSWTIEPLRWSGPGEDARAAARGYQAGTVAVRSTRAARSQSVPPGLHGKVPPPVEPLVRAVPRHGQSGRMDDPLEDHVARTVEVGRCLQDEAVAPVGPRRLAAEQRGAAPREPTPQRGVVRQATRDEPGADGEVRSPRSEPGAGDDRIEVAAGVKAGAERPPGRVVHAVRRAQRDERPVRLRHPP